MRKILFSILLASAAATPALAQDQGDGRWHRDRQQQDQQESRGERGDRGQRGNNERVQQVQVQQVQPQQVQPQQVQNVQRGGWDRGRFQGAPQQVLVPQQRQGDNRAFRAGRNGFDPDQSPQAEQDRQRWNGNRNNWNGQGGNFVQRPGFQQQGDQQQGYQQQFRDRDRWANGGNWDRDWRNDRRYDWRRYRDGHRSIFRLGLYYDPFGYGYQSFNIGFQLSPAYFGQRYWIDPANYELPYPPPGTQWVRYWNDAVLVDMYTGEVVDVIHNFFW